MNFSHQNTVTAHNTTYDFPEIDNIDVNWERQTWMETNCGEWPYFYDVVDWPGAFAGSGWELHEDLTMWLYTDQRLDCNDHYGIVCFADEADTIRFRNRFAPKDREVALYCMWDWNSCVRCG